MLTGLACAVAFRARFYNIGAEGQLYLGALAAVASGGLLDGTGFDLPIPVLFGGMMLAAALAGCSLAPTYERPDAPVDAAYPTGPAYKADGSQAAQGI
ncbi:hypothetical protein G6F40_016281 [Rhizopus arrhizus]|nr:hypothetical protein G6F40_016281 [Rhizopus arrhizus]